MIFISTLWTVVLNVVKICFIHCSYICSSIFMLKHFIKLNIDWNEHRFWCREKATTREAKNVFREQTNIWFLFQRVQSNNIFINFLLDLWDEQNQNPKHISMFFRNSTKNRKTFQGAWNFQKIVLDFQCGFNVKQFFFRFDYSAQQCNVYSWEVFLFWSRNDKKLWKWKEVKTLNFIQEKNFFQEFLNLKIVFKFLEDSFKIEYSLI